MNKLLVLFCWLAGFCWLEAVSYAPAEPDTISARIVALIDISQPVYLEVQAGDLTSTLDFKIRQLLIQKGADLRELNLQSWEAGLNPAEDSLNTPVPDISAPLTGQLVKISMELDWTTLEHRSFFSYRSERRPLYSFQIKQISLPLHRLQTIDNLSFVVPSIPSQGQSPANLRWFEPVLAITALGSLIYLLWNTE